MAQVFGRFGKAAAAAVLLLAAAASFAEKPRVAVLPLENKSGDPRYDYVGAIAGGLLQFDLSSSGALELVDRGALDAALRERELSLSAVAAEPSRLGAGRDAALSGADYLLAGEYVFIGKEILFTLRLIDAATTRASSFSEGGSTENAVHVLAERVVERLSGKRPSFGGEGRGRSLLSLRDETPGSIALHSPLIDAEILLDGAFVGFTTGDRRKPFVIENLEPGEYELSTDLGADFGVVELPAVRFGPWKKRVSVAAGKRSIATDESRHFNSTLYALQQLVSVSASPAEERYSQTRPFSFVDRGGIPRSGAVSAELTLPASGKGGTGRFLFYYDGERRELPVSFGDGASAELDVSLGPVSFTASVEYRYGRYEVRFRAERTDVRQGMHREPDAASSR